MTQDTFNYCTQWQRQTFPNATPQSCAAHLTEEVKELKNAIANNDISNIREEMADCFLLLFGIADRCGFGLQSVESAIIDKMIINLKRKWQPLGEYSKHAETDKTNTNE